MLLTVVLYFVPLLNAIQPSAPHYVQSLRNDHSLFSQIRTTSAALLSAVSKLPCVADVVLIPPLQMIPNEV
jgi:hypothetical protein